jgi:cardiolipin synthase A/B
MEYFSIFNKNHDLYTKMLNDIDNAQKYVYLETYIFNHDEVGKRFIKVLTKKAKEGIKVKLLLDDIGSPVKEKHFTEFIKNGGQIKFFRKFRYNFRIISSNNYRDHRKLLIIDDAISYIGSANIQKKSIDWRDLTIRFTGKLSRLFAKTFQKNFSISDKHVYTKKEHISTLRYKNFEIVRDVPSMKFKKIRKKELELIKKAKNNISIETPYFIPNKKLKKELKQASMRGVKINIALPLQSDVMLINILRQKHLGTLHKSGINILFFKPSILHSKLMIVDNDFFTIGSANLDNRSSLFQYEINLFGRSRKIIKELKNHSEKTLADCIEFDYAKWKKRSIIQKTLEKMLTPIKYLL